MKSLKPPIEEISSPSKRTKLLLYGEVFLGILRKRVTSLEDYGILSIKGGINVKDYGNQRNMCQKCYYLYDKTVKSHQIAIQLIKS